MNAKIEAPLKFAQKKFGKIRKNLTNLKMCKGDKVNVITTDNGSNLKKQ